ncbi:arylsulfatase [Ancylomarina sp. 16SWW S1-10-2]|uniref:arylsulfatase n=1 Tax=Ancylomarina sp. 16SWW S1-10-2 TaxID=2499681 RepID=UPI0012AD3A27|nr:arylsulfatase [Ancylomarina sp. 16SWW S1-10-2]MRT91994.1 arylsulfatase [Ancylomarina sp. 16SWW S1-10-2]
MNKLVFLLIVVLFLSSCNEKVEKKNQTPNIVYILADDLGYGDLSCYGQQKFETPNIDKLAERGMKFTQHYCGSAVCAPSRSTLMTGQHTGHTPIRGNKELDGEGQSPIPASTLTIAEVMKTAGYTTGMFGKWGLGFPGSEGDPNNQGFDEFYGYNCQRMAHRYYPPYLWHNQEKDYLEGNDWTNTVTYAPDKIQDATLQFIENNKDTSFFAYVPLVLPHAELISPKDSISKKFEGKFVEDNPYLEGSSTASDYGPNIIKKKYCSQKAPYATFATMITRLDAYVGQIVAKLEELGIADNTIIMFASDNGPHTEGGANPEFFNSAGGLRGVKRDLYEGGVRTPFIVVWPNKVKAGSVSDHVSAFWDVLPTCEAIVGVKSTSTDGISFLPELLGEPNQKEHDYLYWEFAHKGGRQAVRMGNWKGVIYNISKKGEMQLYNLTEDVAETNNVADQHPDIIAKMKGIMEKEHVDSEIFPLIK